MADRIVLLDLTFAFFRPQHKVVLTRENIFNPDKWHKCAYCGCRFKTSHTIYAITFGPPSSTPDEWKPDATIIVRACDKHTEELEVCMSRVQNYLIVVLNDVRITTINFYELLNRSGLTEVP